MNKLKVIVNIWNLLNNEYRNKLIFLQFFIIISSFLELLSLFSIGPFVSVLLGVIALEDIPLIGQYIVDNFVNIEIYILGSIVGLLIIISNLFFAYTLFKKAKFSYSLGAETSNRIVASFLSNKLNGEIHNKNFIITNATFESDRFAKSVVNELIQINARLLVSISIISFLIFNYGFSFLLFVIYMITIYFIISLFLKERLASSGKKLSEFNNKRLRNTNDIYDCFYEIKSYKSENFFSNRQKNINSCISDNLSKIELYSVLPKYLVESIMLISLISYLCYAYSLNTNINTLIPMAAQLIYGIIKLLPQVSNIYQAYSNFSGNINSVNEISKIKIDEKKLEINSLIDNRSVNKIELTNISFSRKSKYIFKEFNYTFKKNNIYSIKGPSGIGKSTLLSLLFGLLTQDEGEIRYSDDNGIIKKPRIAFIPQNHYMIYGNIDANIGFGINEDSLDKNKISDILYKINLNDIMYNSNSDIKLSGGQTQRICIGRFLYHDYDVVLFDEPTSALDMENEKNIFELIKKNKKNKIIIMVSHSELADKYTDKIIRLG